MKSLVVTCGDSYTTYHGLYKDYVWEISKGVLLVYKLDKHTSEETLIEAHKTWDRARVENT